MADPVHFVLGWSGAATVREALPNAEVVRFTDPLSHGPCRPDEQVDVAEILERRERWWFRNDEACAEHVAEGAPDRERLVSGLASARVRGAVVWVADSVDEQLLACWLAATLLGGSRGDVTISVAKPSARDICVSVGWLQTEELRQASVTRLDAREVQCAAGLWHRFTEPSPEAFVEHVLTVDEGAWLGRLPVLLRRFPAAADGLTDWERCLLRRISTHRGERTAYTVAAVLLDAGAVGDFIRDLVLLDHLHELARGGLLSHSGGRSISEARFALTELGARVLAGDANRLDVAGFDRWIGGAHLQTSGDMWVLDEGRIRRR